MKNNLFFLSLFILATSPILTQEENEGLGSEEFKHHQIGLP